MLQSNFHQDQRRCGRQDRHPIPISHDSPRGLASLLQLAARGWLLHPCKRRDKTPLTKWKSTASADPEVIQGWYHQLPNCNWAVLCGPKSDVWVVDVDDEQGNESLAALIAEHEALPQTLTSLTGRGRHLWFKYPPGAHIPTRAGRLGPCLDVRGAGGYAIVPPSIHGSGREYIWEDANVPVAEPPEWLVELVSRPAPANREISSGEILLRGRRNNGLTTLAGRLRRRGATENAILATLKAENLLRCRPPLPDRELAAIAKSIAVYPPAGPDILQKAWAEIKKGNHATRYQAFLAFVRTLQILRSDKPVALPLERIAELMGVNWTAVRRYRQRAEASGVLVRLLRQFVRSWRLATLYRPHPSCRTRPLYHQENAIYATSTSTTRTVTLYH